jgi:hypothetical protein
LALNIEGISNRSSDSREEQAQDNKVGVLGQASQTSQVGKEWRRIRPVDSVQTGQAVDFAAKFCWQVKKKRLKPGDVVHELAIQ